MLHLIIGIMDGSLVAHGVVVVGNGLALVICGLFQLVQQIHLERGLAQPILHVDQIAGGIVVVRYVWIEGRSRSSALPFKTATTLNDKLFQI